MKNSETQKSPARIEAARIKEAIHKLKRPDKVGVAGMGLGTAAGVGGGTAAAGVLASAAGATTVLGSTTLASTFTFLAAATPIGWIVGCGIAGGAIGLGIAKMIKSGGAQDQIREDIIKRFQAKLDTLQRSEGKQYNLENLKTALSAAMKNNSISDDQAERLIKLVSDGKLQTKVALDRLNAINNTSAAAIK